MAAEKSFSSSSCSSFLASDAFPPLPSHPPSKPPDPPPLPHNPSTSKQPAIDLANPSRASFPSFIKSDYASLFRSTPRNAGSYKPLHFDIPRDGKKKKVPDLVKQEGLNYWNNYLIGFFLDGTLSYHAVSNYLRNHWKLLGNVDIKSDGFHYYFNFSNDSDREKILRSDPIFIRGRMFIISIWDPSIGCAQSQVRKVPVWLHLYKIPMVLWTLLGINWLVNHIGRLICYDISTERLDRFRYAKALVEITPDYELPNAIEVDGLGDVCPIVRVSYDWKPRICTVCKIFGHQTSECDLHANENRDKVNSINVEMGDFRADENVVNQKSNKNKQANVNQDHWTYVNKKKQQYWRKKENDVNTNKAAEANAAGIEIDNSFANLASVNNEAGMNGIHVENPNDLSQPSSYTEAEMIGIHEGDINVQSQPSSINGIQANKEVNMDDDLIGNLFDDVVDTHIETSQQFTGNSSSLGNFTNANVSSSGLSSSSSLAAACSSISGTMSCSSTYSKSSPASSYLNFSSALTSDTTGKAKQSASPYRNLKPPEHLVLPPPAINPALLSTAVPTSAFPSSKSKGKGKFWADGDLDEGNEYSIDDVQPVGSNVKSQKRHTRRNPSPLFDPFIT